MLDISQIQFPITQTRRELNSRYRQIPLEDKTFRLLRKYFTALANLYGIISIKRAYRLISKISPELVTEDEFIAFAEIARNERENYCIMGESEILHQRKPTPIMEKEIIDWALLVGGKTDYLSVKQSQQRKPYYQPSKKELLSYTEMFYCEENENTKSLRNCLYSLLNKNQEVADALFSEIYFATRCRKASLTDVVNKLEYRGAQFRSEKEVKRFSLLYQNLQNGIRTQCNRGHTTNELMLLMGNPEPASDNHLISLFEKKLVAAKKQGRNELCSCGSGKKFKRCCGRQPQH